MANTPSNIMVGAPSSIAIGAYDAAEGACTIVGITEGGVKIMPVREHFFPKGDQYTGKLDAFVTGEDCTVEFVLSEASAANWALALGYPTTAVSGSKISYGGSAVETKRTVYINGVGPGGTGTMKVSIWKCIIIGSTEIALVKDNKVGLKIVLQVLQDTSKTALDQFMEIEYSGTDTTPPTVAMTSPTEDGTVVAGASTTVTLTFTESDNKIDESTLVYGETVMINDIEDPLATALVAGTIVYNSATKTLIFTPTSVWAGAGNNYEIIITKTVRDMAGNQLADVFYGHFVSA